MWNVKEGLCLLLRVAVMKNLSILLGLFLILALQVTAFAQDDEDEARDILEISMYGGTGIPAGGLSDWNDTLGAKVGWQIGIDAGYFLTPEIVIGINFAYYQMEIDNDNPSLTQNHRFYNPQAYLKYYFFSESNFAPYVKGLVGLYNPKFSTPVTDPDGTNVRYRELSYSPALSVGAAAGLFYYTSYYSGLFVEAGFQHAFSESSDKTYLDNNYEFGENISLIDVHAGIIVYFGSGE